MMNLITEIYFMKSKINLLLKNIYIKNEYFFIDLSENRSLNTNEREIKG